MADVSEALSEAPEFPFSGKMYRVSKWTQEMKALCETHMMQNVIDGIMRIQATSPGPLVDRMVYNLELLMAGRELAWGSDQSNRYYFSNEEGIKYRTWIRLKKLNPEVEIELIDRMVEDKVALPLLFTIFRWLDDPNRLGPVPTEPAGLAQG